MDTTDTHAEPHLPSLGSDGILLYTHAVCHGRLERTGLSEQAGLPEPAVEEGLAQLSRLGLLSADPDLPGRYAVVPPDTARELLLGPTVREAGRLQHEIDRVRREFGDLVPLYESAMLRHRPLETLPDLEGLRRMAAELGASAKSEVLLCRPGEPQLDEDPDSALPWAEGLLERGVGMRVLYQHAARFSPAATALVERLVPLGAGVRTLANGLPQFTVFDQHAVLIPALGHPRSGLLIRDRALVEFLAALFDRDWGMATPFADGFVRSEVIESTEELKRSILRALIAGEKDREIAEQLGISHRTCQRHIAELLGRLGAKTRMQAGYLAHQRGIH